MPHASPAAALIAVQDMLRVDAGEERLPWLLRPSTSHQSPLCILRSVSEAISLHRTCFGLLLAEQGGVAAAAEEKEEEETEEGKRGSRTISHAACSTLSFAEWASRQVNCRCSKGLDIKVCLAQQAAALQAVVQALLLAHCRAPCT